MPTTPYKIPVLQNFAWQQQVIDKTHTAPPAAAKGARYIVAAGGSGAWNGKDGQISEYNGAAWDFTPPANGMKLFITAESLFYSYQAGAWSADPPAHALAGPSHTADTIANLQTKISNGSLFTTAAGEIAAATAKGSPTSADFLLIEDAADGNKKKKITIGTLPPPSKYYGAMSIYNKAIFVNIIGAGNWYQVVGSAGDIFTQGILNGFTFSNTGTLTALHAGIYGVDWMGCVSCNVTNQSLAVSLMINGAEQDIIAAKAHFDSGAADPVLYSGCNILSLSANDVLSFCVRNDSDPHDCYFKTGQLKIIQI